MAYTIEDVNSCTKKFSFNFETLDISKEIDSALQKKKKDANIKGFRKGKAPLSMIKKIYGHEVESNALDSFVKKEFFNALEEEKIKPVGYPAFENLEYESEKSVKFEAVVEFFPEIELKDMSSLSFTKEKVEITDSDLEDLKKVFLENKAEMVVLDDESVALENGHFAVMNFQGETEAGDRPENMKGQDFVLEMGKGQFIPGFEEGMLGMKKGENKDIDLTFPEDYHAEDLKNAKVKFEVELLEIKEKKYPELSDELVKEFGFDSVEDFETKNKDQLITRKEREAASKLNNTIIEKLVEENQFDVPDSLVTQQEKHVKQDMEQKLKQQGYDDAMLSDYFEQWKDDITKKALFQVHSGLIMDKLAKEYEVEAGDADIEEKIKVTASEAGVDEEVIRKYYTGNESVKANLLYMIREEKTFAKLGEVLKIS